MVSKRREMLKKYGINEGVFVGTVQYASYNDGHMVLTDIFTIDENNECVKVASHVHIYNVHDPILYRLQKQDMIMFKGVVGDYTTHKNGSVIRNFSFDYVNSIRRVRR